MEKWEKELKKLPMEHHDIEDVWERINHEMQKDLKKERRRLMMQRSWMGIVATMVLVIGTLIYFSMNMQSPNQATEDEPVELPSSTDSDSTNADGDNELTRGEPGFVKQELDKLSERYPEEQDVPLLIEGTEELIPMVRVVPKNFAYVLYADEEHYNIGFPLPLPPAEVVTSVALIKAKEQLGGEFPEIKLIIETLKGLTPSEVVLERKSLLEQQYPGATIKAEPVTEPVVGYKLHAREGDNPSSEVTTIYVLDQQHDESTIVVTQTVFLEAQEGHGARFHAMLKTLEVLE